MKREINNEIGVGWPNYFRIGSTGTCSRHFFLKRFFPLFCTALTDFKLGIPILSVILFLFSSVSIPLPFPHHFYRKRITSNAGFPLCLIHKQIYYNLITNINKQNCPHNWSYTSTDSFPHTLANGWDLQYYNHADNNDYDNNSNNARTMLF